MSDTTYTLGLVFGIIGSVLGAFICLILLATCLVICFALIRCYLYNNSPSISRSLSDIKDEVKPINRTITRMENDIKDISQNTREMGQEVKEIKIIMSDLFKGLSSSKYYTQIK